MLDFKLKLQDGAPIGHQVVRCIYLGRIKNNKPCITFIAGDSGEGKSYTGVRILEMLEDNPDIENQIIYTPFEYVKKISWLLWSPESKGHNVLIMTEARELIKAKLWYSLLNQSIGDTNAMCRSIKPIIFIVISQDIGDIDSSVRKTINYYGVCSRPMGSKTRLRLNRTWKIRDINNPKIYYRNLRGILYYPDGTEKKITIKRFLMQMPTKEHRDRFDELDLKAKEKIIKAKLKNIDTALNKEVPKSSQIEELAENIISAPELITLVMKKDKRGQHFKLRPQYQKMYNLSSSEYKTLEENINNKLKERGLIENQSEAV